MRPLSFIWDLDGTLVDSYPSIVPAAQEICSDLGLNYSKEYIRNCAIKYSIGTLLDQAAAELDIDAEPVKRRFNILNDIRIEEIQPIPHAADTLSTLCQAGHQNFLYTHRGASCKAILDRAGLTSFFTDILTALSGFPRKPAPDGILYLMKKHGLAREDCFYVGDRSMDIQAAENAGIRSILFLAPDSPITATGCETYVVHDLLEIPKLMD